MDEEIAIFKKSKQPQIDKNACPKKEFSVTGIALPI